MYRNSSFIDVLLNISILDATPRYRYQISREYHSSSPSAK